MRQELENDFELMANYANTLINNIGGTRVVVRQTLDRELLDDGRPVAERAQLGFEAVGETIESLRRIYERLHTDIGRG